MKFHAYSEKLATFLELIPKISPLFRNVIQKNSPSPQLPVADQQKRKTGRCPAFTIC